MSEEEIKKVLAKYGVEATCYKRSDGKLDWHMQGGLADSHDHYAYLRWDSLRGFHCGTTGTWLNQSKACEMYARLWQVIVCLEELHLGGAPVWF